MKRFVIISCLLVAYFGNALAVKDSAQIALEKYFHYRDSIEKTFNYIKGDVTLGDNLATLKVPKGYKFLNSEQTKFVMSELWGNPPSESLGMLLPENITPLSDTFTYAIEISYSEEGYIKDKDADKIDYDDLLKDIQKDVNNDNPERKKQGYPTFELVRWASVPYYDKNSKKLHWAKELKFEGEESNTLNYNIRILGRKGVLVMNVISDIKMLPRVKKDINYFLSSVEFNKGYQYSEFNPEIDKVAAYGIAGLVAGKVLAKAGFFLVILKFWKLIALAVVGFFAAFKKKLFGKKESV